MSFTWNRTSYCTFLAHLCVTVWFMQSNVYPVTVLGILQIHDLLPPHLLLKSSRNIKEISNAGTCTQGNIRPRSGFQQYITNT